MTDAELIARTRAGDPDAFGLLISRYYSACWRFAYHMLGERADAEDAVPVVDLLPLELKPAIAYSFEPFGRLVGRVNAHRMRSALRGENHRVLLFAAGSIERSELAGRI